MYVLHYFNILSYSIARFTWIQLYTVLFLTSTVSMHTVSYGQRLKYRYFLVVRDIVLFQVLKTHIWNKTWKQKYDKRQRCFVDTECSIGFSYEEFSSVPHFFSLMSLTTITITTTTTTVTTITTTTTIIMFLYFDVQVNILYIFFLCERVRKPISQESYVAVTSHKT